MRSDSDLYTYGYHFKPWTGAPIATAAEIRNYLGEVITEHGLYARIRYHHRVSSAAWDSVARRWRILAFRTDTGEEVGFTCQFLFMCQGFFRHGQGYTPKWLHMERFKGQIVHPQNWPEGLSYLGQRVIVIGSGATAVILVPNMTDKAGHVTMLQRSPTFFRTGRNAIDLADDLRRLQMDKSWIHRIVRQKILYEEDVLARRTVAEPEATRAELLAHVHAQLGESEEVAKPFTPSYRPWHQHIAFLPDGDLFRQVAAGRASVVTGEIHRFVPRGILLKSGATLEADLIITATGFEMNVLGDIAFSVDGKPLNFAETVTYRGMMFTGLPNFAWVFGYVRAAWTLRAELVADFVCRLLNHMEKQGVEQVEVALRPEDADMRLLPWIDGEDFNPGYLMRGLHLLPWRGKEPEWAHTQDYRTEKDALPAINLSDAAFRYH